MNHAWLGRERGSVSTFQVSSAAGNTADECALTITRWHQAPWRRATAAGDAVFNVPAALTETGGPGGWPTRGR